MEKTENMQTSCWYCSVLCQHCLPFPFYHFQCFSATGSVSWHQK